MRDNLLTTHLVFQSPTKLSPLKNEPHPMFDAPIPVAPKVLVGTKPLTKIAKKLSMQLPAFEVQTLSHIF